MLCPACFGKGTCVIPKMSEDAPPIFMLCVICGGNGIIHCCEGEQEQPETGEEEKK